MRVVLAYTGEVLELPCSDISTLKDAILAYTSIPHTSQAIVGLEDHLPEQIISAESLYVFDKRHVDDPELCTFTDFNVVVSHRPLVPPGVDSKESERRKYDFELFSRKAEAMLETAVKQLKGAQLHFEYLCNQGEAIQCAWASLLKDVVGHEEYVQEFTQGIEESKKEFERLLGIIEPQTKVLGSIELEKCFHSSGKRVLLDYFSVEKLQSNAKTCSNALECLIGKSMDSISQSKELISNVRSRAVVSDVFLSLDISLETLQGKLDCLSLNVTTFESLFADLKHDFQVIDEVRDLSSLQASTMLLRTKLVDLEDDNSRLYSSFRDSRKKVHNYFHSSMLQISSSHNLLNDRQNRLSMYQRSFRKLETDFLGFRTLELLPKAYSAALSEILRRQRRNAMLSDVAKQWLVEMDRLTELENERRREFSSTLGRFIPKALVNLNFLAPEFQLQLGRNDDAILDLNITGVESPEGEDDIHIPSEELSKEKQRSFELEAQLLKAQQLNTTLEKELQESKADIIDLKGALQATEEEFKALDEVSLQLALVMKRKHQIEKEHKGLIEKLNSRVCVHNIGVDDLALFIRVAEGHFRVFTDSKAERGRISRESYEALRSSGMDSLQFILGRVVEMKLHLSGEKHFTIVSHNAPQAEGTTSI